ncbi:uncharacterized protein METZ01_LOCUS164567 [marine metagenome]|uniref:4Fe-4S ferredoxin-type domain-containing protein n=1 Tax=marine metagenome TaxID=408172 RepID=A0A382BEN3_9ZZZZ
MTTEPGSAVADYLGLELPSKTAPQRARLAALARGLEGSAEPTSLVSYNSTGLVLIIGAEPSALSVVEDIVGRVTCLILATGSASMPESSGSGYTKHSVAGQEVPVLYGMPLQINGYLGSFRVLVQQKNREIELAKAMNLASGGIDIILDLGRNPVIGRERVPPGYFAPAGDSDRLHQALEEIPSLVGQFDKPLYVQYKPDICAHGERGITGCTRCLDVCPAEALSSLVGRIEVDPYLCHGVGSCAAVCPTGAIHYRFPNLGHSLDSLRRIIAAFLDQAETSPSILLYEGEHGGPQLAERIDTLPADIIPWRIEEAGSTGLELWLSAIAYGAQSVLIMTTDETPHSTVSALQSQVRLVSILLDGLELGAERVRLVGLDQLNPISGTANGGSVRVVKPASYGGIDEKRVVLRFATEHLATGLTSDIDHITLPPGSPFGSVQVDAQVCTLCMGCVSVCPAGAIGDDKAKPRLTFVESNCVQCGICEQACPEDAISLVPRLLLDNARRMQHQTLNEEAPFCCIDCGKPFTTQSMITKMEEKLSGHRMFQGDALKTLQRCEDCRVKAMF